MSPKKPLQAVRRDYDANLMKEWVLAFIERRRDKLRVYCSLPQEETCLIVPRVHFEAHIAMMRRHVARKSVHHLFDE
jgi:hypothetical protein